MKLSVKLEVVMYDDGCGNIFMDGEVVPFLTPNQHNLDFLKTLPLKGGEIQN